MRFGSLGPVELLLIVLAIVLIFGASKLGDIGGALGKSIKEFKKASTDEEAAAARQSAAVEEPQAPAPVATSVTSAPADKPSSLVGDYRPPDARPS